MDRNKGGVAGLQEAPGAMADKCSVRRFVGRCPLGGCSKAGQDMGRGYEDNGDDARKRVWNHLRYSPAHMKSFTSDEEVDDLLDSDVDAWLLASTQEWLQSEFDQHFLVEAEPELEEDYVEESASAVPEPDGSPKGKGKGKGKGKDKGSGKGKGKSKAEPDLTTRLERQIRQQTQNMLHFTRAASTCISALKVAADMCRQASTTFDRQREGMEEGMEEMIAAFGIDPPQRRHRQNAELTFSSSSNQIDLARQVRRGAPY